METFLSELIFLNPWGAKPFQQNQIPEVYWTNIVDTPYVSPTVLMNIIFQSWPGRELKMGDNDS
jgi:hypothetical protein